MQPSSEPVNEPAQQPAAPPPTTPPPLAQGLPLESGEQVLATIKRHPIGLVVIYLQALGAVIALGGLAFLLAPDFLRDLSGEAYTLLTVFSILMLALLAFVLMLATSVYRQNRLIITDHGIVQTLQKGPFGRKTSRLSMSDVEDVTSEQKGILQTIFNYGTLNVETAGELKNFVFPYAPNPSHYANIIVDARHKFAKDPGGH